MKILLAYKANEDGAKDPFTSLLPTGLGYINAWLCANGLRSRVANFSGFSWKETEAEFARLSPDIVGISQFTHNRFAALRLAKLAKKVNPACRVVLGGAHAASRYEQVLSSSHDVEVVVMGEGEETFRELAEAWAASRAPELERIGGIAFRKGGRLVVTLPRKPLADLDSLPYPASYMADATGVDLRRQMEFVITSRGCPAQCHFCSSPGFWRRNLRYRSPSNIVEEIRYLRDHHGIIYFSFRDDTFTADRERVIEFCRLLIEERLFILWNCQSRVTAVDANMLGWMKRAGCECVQFGVESGSRRVLEILGKRITSEQIVRAARLTRDAGINLSIYLITGVPGETREDLGETLRLIETIRPHDGQVAPLAYYPGTSLYEEAVRSGLAEAGMFEVERTAGLYVRHDRFVTTAMEEISAKLWTVGEKSRYTRRDFARHVETAGWCHATAFMAGEECRGRGDWKGAERWYREMTVREPDNPWGWLLIAELFADEGLFADAEAAYEAVIRLVPAYAPAFAALGEIWMAMGDRRMAEQHFRRCLELHPQDQSAREGLKQLAAQRRKRN
ncbi:MAG: radical SAM protein [Geobacter sp.]|nr:radical SAM protein [Geobacter sp.]